MLRQKKEIFNIAYLYVTFLKTCKDLFRSGSDLDWIGFVSLPGYNVLPFITKTFQLEKKKVVPSSLVNLPQTIQSNQVELVGLLAAPMAIDNITEQSNNAWINKEILIQALKKGSNPRSSTKSNNSKTFLSSIKNLPTIKLTSNNSKILDSNCILIKAASDNINQISFASNTYSITGQVGPVTLHDDDGNIFEAQFLFTSTSILVERAFTTDAPTP